MNPTIQSGMHPDADTLTAFAEHLLTANEREQVQAHAAVCGRCREVIFLAQQAAAEEEVSSAAMPILSAKKRASRWLGGWRWAWLPAAAMAVMITISIVLHFQRADLRTEMARNSTPSQPLEQSSLAQTSRNSQPNPPATNALQRSKPQAERDLPAAPQDEEMLDRKETRKRRELGLGAPPPPAAISPGLASGSMHGAFAARAQGTPYDGPMANQSNQNALQQQNAIEKSVEPRQNLPKSARTFSRIPADNQMGGAILAPESKSVAVETEAAKATLITPSPAPSTHLSYAPMANKAAEISPAATAQLKKAATVALPGGSQVLSVASAADRTIAIDTSGALFLTEDQGRHWQPVTMQWTGRAVLVRNKLSNDKADSFEAVPPVRFELINDKLQTWMSLDGKTWTAEKAPQN